MDVQGPFVISPLSILPAARSDNGADSDVSRTATIALSAYLRTQPSVPGEDQADMGNDVLMSRAEFTPVLDAHNV